MNQPTQNIFFLKKNIYEKLILLKIILKSII